MFSEGVASPHIVLPESKRTLGHLRGEGPPALSPRLLTKKSRTHLYLINIWMVVLLG